MALTEKEIIAYVEEYKLKVPFYKQLSEAVKGIINYVLDDKKIVYHSISCREKGLESFKEKIARKKYDNPFKDMQDLAALRIITYIDDDVKAVCSLVEEIFEVIEKSDKGSLLEDNKFGYKSVHYVAKFTQERLKLPEYSKFKDDVFEIQVRTLLQHAWAEFEHDRNYKFSGVLPKESGIQRRLALVAGALELADKEFNSIALDLEKYKKEAAIEVQKGELDIEINSTSLREYLTMKYKTLIDKGIMEANYANKEDNSIELINELNDFGIKTLRDLDNITPKNFIEKIEQHQRNTNFIGCTRDLMMIHDSERYFKDVWKGHWGGLDSDTLDMISEYSSDFYKYLHKYELSVNRIESDI
ncbi:MAG: hypothetical protein K0R80_3220 [Clostridia bacterium]|jgi:ppGpp synthetase/RelA/SpoT-type nucleotidyltranferase|nr:hypothetical protein [Clostridia bacterium]